MKKKLTYTFSVIALVAVMVTFYSCNDEFFDQQAGDRLDPKKHYASQVDLELSMYGALIPLQTAIPNLIIVDGLRSDLMDVTPNADVYLKALNEQNITADNAYIDPSDYYKVIINVNEVLANIDKIQDVERTFDDFTKHQITGYLVGLRVWSYFMLVRLYGEAAIIPDNVTALPEKQTFLSKEVMIDTLINQLTPFIHTQLNKVEWRMPRYLNTKAILGELYLEKNDYVNAVKYLKAAVESYGNADVLFKVELAFQKEAWRNIFINSENNMTEVISAIPFTSMEDQDNPLAELMMYSGKYAVKPSTVLINSYQSQIQLRDSVRGDFYRGVGVTYDTLAGGTSIITKYTLEGGDLLGSDIIIQRAADIHLLLAEALNRSGDTTNALTILNSGFNALSTKPAAYFSWNKNLGIRGRAYLLPKTVPAQIPSVEAKIEMIEDFIIAERALEMAYEGKRWFDLVRIAKRRGNPAYLADKIAAKFSDPAVAASVKAKLMNETNWYLPMKK